MKKPKQKKAVRPWAYAIWRQKNQKYGSVLATLPTDGNKLEALIQEYGELTVMVAWLEYVYADPPMYNLEPVTHVAEGTYKSGKKWMAEAEDQSAITKFPLTSFLKVPDGFIAEAQHVISQPGWRAAKQKQVDHRNEWFTGIFGND